MLTAFLNTPVRAEGTGARVTISCSSLSREEAEGMRLRIYRIAFTDSKSALHKTVPYSMESFDAEHAKRLAASIHSEPTYTVTMHHNSAELTNLESGIYLLTAENREVNQVRIEPVPSFFAVNAERAYLHVDMKVTAEGGPKDTVSYRVSKIWHNDSANCRPSSIMISIMKNGFPYRRIRLSEENRWCYEWEGERGARYTVKEEHVPYGYAARVSGTDTDIVLINTRNMPVAATGDRIQVRPMMMLAIGAMIGSIVLLTLLRQV